MDASRARGCKETARAARGIAVWPLKMKRYIILAQKPGSLTRVPLASVCNRHSVHRYV